MKNILTNLNTWFLRFISIILFFLNSSNLLALSDTLLLAPNTKVIVDSIVIKGNSVTEDFVILRELNFEVGDEIDSKIINYNRERVYSLDIFNDVQFLLIDKDELITLIIEVKESWYIYPIPFIYIKDNDLSLATYGINFTYKNFRGRNEKIVASFGLGLDPFFNLNYINPSFIREKNIFYYHSFKYQKVLNKSEIAENLFGEEFSNIFVESKIGLGRRVNLFHLFNVFLGYEYWEVPRYVPGGLSAGTERIDRFPKIEFNYVYDTRDLIQYPLSGIYSSIDFKVKGFGLTDVNHQVLSIDFREYRNILNKFSSKWRIYFRKLFGDNLPYYDHSYLGFSEFIRGYVGQTREGHNLLKTSLEFRFPIIERMDINFPKFPLVPEQFLFAKFGLYLELFLDTGTTFNNDENLSLKNFDSGYGIGLSLLFLPYNSLRIYYAYDEFKKGEILFGTGISF